MANNQAYGFGQPLRNIFPSPVVAERAPGNGDKLEIGREWVNTVAQDVYFLAGYSGGNPVWINSAGGAGLFASLTVTPGPTALTGALTVTSGTNAVNISADAAANTVNVGTGAGAKAVTIGSTNTTSALTLQSGSGAFTITAGGIFDLNLTGAVTVDTAAGISLDAATASNFTVTGAGQDLTLSSVGGSVLVSSTEDAALAIYLRANGGVAETIDIHSDQGTGVASVNVHSDVGGVTVASGLASDDAINLTASAGGVDIDGALQVNIESSEAAADAVRVFASNVAGGIDVDSGTTGIDVDSTGSISLVSSLVASALSVEIEASAADGGVTIKAGSAGVLIGNQADTALLDLGNIAPTSSRTITVGGGTVVVAAVTDTIDVGVDGATTNADSAKVVNIGTGAVDVGSNTVNIGTGALTTSGTNSVNISTGAGVAGGTKRVTIGNVDGLTDIIELVPRESSAGAAHTLNASKGRITATGLTTGAGADETITITNSSVSATSGIIVGICTLGANDARPVLERVVPGAGSFTIQYVNEGAAALNGDLIISFEVFN